MGSGDELRLIFDASKLSPLPPGWTRDFLLKVDGWAKDRDPNTAFSQTVEPLPFHGMTRYPYPATEHFPQDQSHLNYQHDYNTSPAFRLIRPLQGSWWRELQLAASTSADVDPPSRDHRERSQ